MSHNLPLEIDLAKQSENSQYLVRDCAHQVQQLLDRYKDPLVTALALELVAAQRQESIPYA